MTDAVLEQAQQNILLPTKVNANWVVKLRENNIWKLIDFDLQEDAWSFFYSKLNELKSMLLGKPLQIQR
ncbi:MAG: hypothetical protein J5691_01655 [Bacilli bacterium]|nr:hypothetical protein [Bacilli bacterium]